MPKSSVGGSFITHRGRRPRRAVGRDVWRSRAATQWPSTRFGELSTHISGVGPTLHPPRSSHFAASVTGQSRLGLASCAAAERRRSRSTRSRGYPQTLRFDSINPLMNGAAAGLPLKSLCPNGCAEGDPSPQGSPGNRCLALTSEWVAARLFAPDVDGLLIPRILTLGAHKREPRPWRSPPHR